MDFRQQTMQATIDNVSLKMEQPRGSGAHDGAKTNGNRSRKSREKVSQGELHNFYAAAVANQLAVALWRAPHAVDRHAIVDLSGTALPAKIDFHTATPGFAFSPFVNENGHATLFLRADLHLDRNGVADLSGTPSLAVLPGAQDVEATRRRFLNTFGFLMEQDQEQPPTWYASEHKRTPGMVSNREAYCQLVRDAMAYIDAVELKKIVVSRVTDFALPDGFDPLSTFDQLCQRYPHAFVSLVAIPRVGTWIGASPETLLRVGKTGLKTVALAGTQARPQSNNLDEVTWGSKEIEEQALVSDYIRDFFLRAGVSEVIEKGPRTVTAGTVIHLKTTFEIHLESDARFALANRILNELHPTSAVCGMPKDKALAFIREHEGYDRRFYSGFLGPVHIDGRSDLFVNLRCMELDERIAWLYVGGGVTADSDPEAEWQETMLKAQTLLSVLQNNERAAIYPNG
jgi:isochorismate synthase